MRRLVSLSFALSLCTSSIAIAADPAVSSPKTKSWTGFYAGAFVGGRASNVKSTACGGGPIGQNCPTNFSLDGLIAGFTGGFDYQFSNNFVLGAFVSLPVARPTTTTTTPLFAPFGLSWKVAPQHAVYAGARLGYAMGDFMPYVLAGASLARVKVTPLPQPAQTSTATHIGAFLGAGLEMRLTPNVSIDGRYVLGLLGDAQYEFCGLPGCRSSYDEVSHNFTLGLNYRF